jgi:hypothetical protein
MDMMRWCDLSDINPRYDRGQFRRKRPLFLKIICHVLALNEYMIAKRHNPVMEKEVRAMSANHRKHRIANDALPSERHV